MKRLLLAFAFLPLTAGAQHWNVSLAGGMSTNTIPEHVSYYEKPSISPALGVSLSRQGKKWEAGLKATCISIATKVDGLVEMPQDDLKQVNIKTFYAHRALALTPFLNYHFGSGSNRFYAGLNAGIAPTFKGNIDNDPDYLVHASETTDQIKRAYNSGVAFTAGAQFGYVRSLTKRLNMGIELSPDYFGGKFGDGIYEKKEQIMVLYFTGMIKVGYRL